MTASMGGLDIGLLLSELEYILFLIGDIIGRDKKTWISSVINTSLL